jgi:hypothetical protein
MADQTSNQNARAAARALAVARIGIGTVAFTYPRLALRPWIGPDADRPTSRLLARALGARDIALGLGALLAISHDSPARGWLEAGGLADAGDVLTTLVGWRAAPRGGKWMVLAAASSGVIGAALLAKAVDEK